MTISQTDDGILKVYEASEQLARLVSELDGGRVRLMCDGYFIRSSQRMEEEEKALRCAVKDFHEALSAYEMELYLPVLPTGKAEEELRRAARRMATELNEFLFQSTLHFTFDLETDGGTVKVRTRARSLHDFVFCSPVTDEEDAFAERDLSGDDVLFWPVALDHVRRLLFEGAEGSPANRILPGPGYDIVRELSGGSVFASRLPVRREEFPLQ